MEKDIVMKRFITGLAAASLFLVCAVNAQEETPRNTQQRNQNQTTKQRNQETQTTQKRNQQSGSQDEMKIYLLGKLVLMNECEIQLSKVAQKRSSTQEVKEFARMLEQDHSKLNEKIRAANPDFEKLIDKKRFQNQTTGIQNPENASPAEKQPGSQKEPNELAQNPAAPKQENKEEGETRTTQKATFPDNPEWEGKSVYHILKHDCEASQKFLQASIKMLEEHQGQDFDMAFLGLQIAGHTRALAELEAVDSSTVQDEQCREILREAKTGVQKHLQHAKQLSKKYEDREDRDTETPNRTTQPKQPQRNPALPRTQPQPQPE
jgi:predicted outer membrane protein